MTRDREIIDIPCKLLPSRKIVQSTFEAALHRHSFVADRRQKGSRFNSKGMVSPRLLSKRKKKQFGD